MNIFEENAGFAIGIIIYAAVLLLFPGMRHHFKDYRDDVVVIGFGCVCGLLGELLSRIEWPAIFRRR